MALFAVTDAGKIASTDYRQGAEGGGGGGEGDFGHLQLSVMYVMSAIYVMNVLHAMHVMCACVYACMEAYSQVAEIA